MKLYFHKHQLSSHAVEDLTQEVLCRALEGLPRFRGSSQLSTWLYGISRNVLYQYFRDKKKNLTLEGEWESSQDKTEEKIEWKMIVDTLPKHLKIIYERKYGLGMSIREISSDLGLPQGTVKYHLYKIRSILKKEVHSE